jgi:hypothetical protein
VVSIGCIHCSVVASIEESKGKWKSQNGNGRVKMEMEESKWKWKSQKGNGRVETEMEESKGKWGRS